MKRPITLARLAKNARLLNQLVEFVRADEFEQQAVMRRMGWLNTEQLTSLSIAPQQLILLVHLQHPDWGSLAKMLPGFQVMRQTLLAVYMSGDRP